MRMRRPHFITTRFALVGVFITATVASVFGAARTSTTRFYPIADPVSGLLLGAASPQGWKSAGAIANRMRGGETYRLYGLAGRAGTAKGTKPQPTDPPIEGQYDISLSPKPTGDLVGLTAPWNPLPHMPQRLNPNGTLYRAALVDYLKRKGLKNPKPRITQIYRVELEGDGTDEVILAAAWPPTDTPPVHAKQGYYSVVLLRKVVNGKVVTIPLTEDLHTRPSTPERWEISTFYRIAALLDLNGDGRMEILVRGSYYEGTGINAYVVEGRRVQKVLEAYFGV